MGLARRVLRPRAVPRAHRRQDEQHQGGAPGQDAGPGHRRVSGERPVSVPQGARDRQPGSTFYLALYWAQALAAQHRNEALGARFTEVAHALAESEAVITEELLAAQGEPVDIGGYYHPDAILVERVMRPSAAFNAIIDAM